MGPQTGGRAAVTKVNTSGTTVTWVSGPNFANVVQPGMFVVMNAGGEYFVSAKASSTSLTVASSPGTTSNVEAIIGSGDSISVANGSFNVITNNYVEGGATAHIGSIVANGSGAGADARYNVITGNTWVCWLVNAQYWSARGQPIAL